MPPTLPDGTDLRMHCKGETYHARVTGDAIVYQGRRVSAPCRIYCGGNCPAVSIKAILAAGFLSPEKLMLLNSTVLPVASLAAFTRQSTMPAI